jgi:hypothetical protein
MRVMTKAIALSRQIAFTGAEMLRSVIVVCCACALIAAGEALPF